MILSLDEIKKYNFFDKYVNYRPKIEYNIEFKEYIDNIDYPFLFIKDPINRFIVLDDAYFYKSQIISNKNKILVISDKHKLFFKENNLISYINELNENQLVINKDNFEDYNIIDFPVFYFKYPVNNYLHFNLDTVPYLSFYLTLKKQFNNIKLFIPMNKNWILHGFFYNILKEFGITEDDMFLPYNGIYNMKFNKLIIVEPSEIFKKNWNQKTLNNYSIGRYLHSEFIYNNSYQKIVNKTNNIKKIKKKYYYLSRRIKSKTNVNIGQNNLSKRICINEDALVELLKEYNIEEIWAEDYNFLEKINFFNEAEYIFSVYSAGISNGFYTNNVNWIIFNTPSISVNWYEDLILKKNKLKYYNFYERIKNDKIENAPWKIDLDQVKKVLDSLDL
jgi:hypothetical protein